QRLQTRPDIRVQVGLTERLRLTQISTALTLNMQIKTGPKVLKSLPIVPATGDHRAEHRRERVPRHTQPVCPRPVLPALVHDGLANVEEHSPDHQLHAPAAGTQTTSRSHQTAPGQGS